MDGIASYYISVAHEGNRRSSEEEVAAMARVVGQLLQYRFRDEAGSVWTLTGDDIPVFAPFNVHVQQLAAALPPKSRVGTVDRFPAREARVGIYTTAASSPEHLPHGMKLLFSRLNVAISRAYVWGYWWGASRSSWRGRQRWTVPQIATDAAQTAS